MSANKRIQRKHQQEIRLTLDGRKRVNLSKLMPDFQVSSFKAHTEGNKIILEPMTEIPAEEVWLFNNPNALKQVQTGLQQSKDGKVKSRGSFAQYAEDDV